MLVFLKNMVPFMNKKSNLFFIFFLFWFFPLFTFADLTVTNSTVVSISAQVNGDTTVVVSSGGGGGISSSPTTVNISGVAYPLSKVTILQDGKIVATTTADPAAKFAVSLTGMTTNTYTFSVYGEDTKNIKSLSFSFPVFITSGTTVNISNIFLSPTVDTDKSQVKQGDNLAIFGQSAPESQVTISVHSDQERFYKVNSNKSGLFLYNLDTTPLELGRHETKAKVSFDSQLSSFSPPVEFFVGTENKKKDSVCTVGRKGDLNCDKKVNLVDFSVMAFWFKKLSPPKTIDLNGDGKVTLVDFSIMAYNWTG